MSELQTLRADLAEAEALVEEVKGAMPPLEPAKERVSLRKATRKIRTVLENAIRDFLLGPGSPPPPPPKLHVIGNLKREIKREFRNDKLLALHVANTLSATSEEMKANENLDSPQTKRVEDWLKISYSFLDALDPIFAERKECLMDAKPDVVTQ